MERQMRFREELQQFIGLLSEQECKYLLRAVKDVVEDEPFWEDDVGRFYNEYVKLRYIKMPRDRATLLPAPTAQESSFVPIPVIKSYSDARRVQLPHPERLTMPLVEALVHRRSRRSYAGTSMSLGQLSSLVAYACGVTGFLAAYGYEKLPLRTFPSHGGLQSSEIYVSAHRVEHVPVGIYHYHATDHALELIDESDRCRDLCTAAFNERAFESAAAVFLITGYYERLKWKYGERAYRFICIDSGFVCENFYLVSEALGLGACAISGFAQDRVEEIFGVDGKTEIGLVLLTVGVRGEGDGGGQQAQLPSASAPAHDSQRQ
jgi:SagB-type dehydrogenase family enzyme